MFNLVSKHKPKGDQPEAIRKLNKGLSENVKAQILLGATGTGKTFTISNVVQNYNKPTMIIVHNKTLAGQLYEEMKSLFPNNRVEYFISNFDYYQPEAYLPGSDSYIDKTTKHNTQIGMMRMSALNALTMKKNETIVIASVAAIYGARSPIEYKSMFFELEVGQIIERKDLIVKLVSRSYKRNNISLEPGTFRVKGDVIEIVPGWSQDMYFIIDMFGNEIEMIALASTLTGEISQKYKSMTFAPADDYASTSEQREKAIKEIEKELQSRLRYFEDKNLLVEKQRLEVRTRNDLESLKEFGTCSGIENYSLHMDGRKIGTPPYTLLDYMGKDWLLIVDESHITVPQISGMFNGDRARKTNLVEYGFRLPSALDNRPLNFKEFIKKTDKIIYLSATPGEYETEHVLKNNISEQIIRPTGVVDAEIEVIKKDNQIDRIIKEVKNISNRDERTFITVLTKKMAEDLSEHLVERGLKVAYLHSELKALERLEVLRQLRIGRYEAVVGINLLREGLDLPEVSLVCILDADKMGFLRDTRSLIQTIGRACRNINGRVLMFADKISNSMKDAISETTRRRKIQTEYNKKNNITPTTIKKDILGPMEGNKLIENIDDIFKNRKRISKDQYFEFLKDLRKQMVEAAKREDFEQAAILRDAIIELEKQQK